MIWVRALANKYGKPNFTLNSSGIEDKINNS